MQLVFDVVAKGFFLQYFSDTNPQYLIVGTNFLREIITQVACFCERFSRRKTEINALVTARAYCKLSQSTNQSVAFPSKSTQINLSLGGIQHLRTYPCAQSEFFNGSFVTMFKYLFMFKCCELNKIVRVTWWNSIQEQMSENYQKAAAHR